MANKLGLFNWVDGIAGTGDLVAQDSSISGTGDVTGVISADFVLTYLNTVPNVNESMFFDSVNQGTFPSSDVQTGLLTGILDLPDIGLTFDLAGLTMFYIGVDQYFYYPAGTSSFSTADFTLFFDFDTLVPLDPRLDRIEIQIANGNSAGNKGSYFSDLGAAVNDSATYTE